MNKTRASISHNAAGKKQKQKMVQSRTIPLQTASTPNLQHTFQNKPPTQKTIRKGGKAAVRSLQHNFGNQSMVQLLQFPLQADEKKEAAGGLLNKRQVRSALAFYRKKSKTFTAANIKRIQSAIGTAQTGVMSESDVQEIAKFQQSHPPMKPDGKAGYRTLPVLFPFGLAKKASISKFVTDTRSEIGKWATYPTKEKRAEALVKQANERLKAAGVPDCDHAVRDLGGSEGEFDAVKWEIAINDKLVSKPAITPKEAASVTNTVYHEARHAEQFFTILRKYAGEGKNAKQIHDLTGVKKSVIPAAMGKKAIKKNSLEAMVAEGWYKSIYHKGPMGWKSKKIQNGVDKYWKKYETYKKKYDKAHEATNKAFDKYFINPTNKNKRAYFRKNKISKWYYYLYNKASKTYDKFLKQYQSYIPDEADAYVQERAVVKEYMKKEKEAQEKAKKVK